MAFDSVNAQIKELEDEIKKTQYNKATQHHIGLIKAKIARLREKLESRAGGGKKGAGYTVKKSGDATVILVGFPSVGKSTLMNRIADVESKIGAYAFTTVNVVPGVMEYKHAKIQILDVPGILKGAAAGTGRGKEVLSVVRSSDLVMYIVDVLNPEEQYDVLKKELYNF
ncbi:50S ribosome-binding GTPase, partial [Candidatus Woesearchaeota archaeon]|nr:50S ribosome-binding GTPase [Candidatus Woesearchaeota archaeon]